MHNYLKFHSRTSTSIRHTNVLIENEVFTFTMFSWIIRRAVACIFPGTQQADTSVLTGAAPTYIATFKQTHHKLSINYGR